MSKLSDSQKSLLNSQVKQIFNTLQEVYDVDVRGTGDIHTQEKLSACIKVEERGDHENPECLMKDLSKNEMDKQQGLLENLESKTLLNIPKMTPIFAYVHLPD